MTKKDSAQLLKQCDTGVQMGMEALNQATAKIKDPIFLDIIKEAFTEHKRIEEDIDRLEMKLGIEKPSVNPIVNGMRKIKSDVLFAVNQKDCTVAKLMSDGTHMGVTILNKELNRKQKALPAVRDIAEEIIDVEDDFMIKIRPYL